MRWPRVTFSDAFRLLQFVVGMVGFLHEMIWHGPSEHPIFLAVCGILMGLPVLWPSATPQVRPRDDEWERDRARRPADPEAGWDEERERQRRAYERVLRDEAERARRRGREER